MEKLDRSDNAIIASQVFNLHDTDLIVYVEDHDDNGVSEKFYEIILKRIFDGKQLEVKTTGGREKVIRLNQVFLDNPTYNALFIIDGDFKILHTPSEIIPRGLFRLEKYCIENYLIQEAAIITVLCENHTSMKTQQISEMLNFKKWEEHICSSTHNLVILYAVCDRLRLGKIKTSKRKLEEYKHNEHGILSLEAISSIEIQINNALYSKSEAQVEDMKSNIKQVIQDKNLTPMDTLSGKSLLLPLVLQRSLRIVEKMYDDPDLFMHQLARKCDLSDLAQMKDSVYYVDVP